MKVLGLDTSTRTGGAALIEDDALVGEYLLGVAAEHDEKLMPAVARIMSDAGWTGRDLDLIAVAAGPGSFTGLRIGVTAAKALAYAWNKPLVGVSTLAALAWQVTGYPGLIVPALNARRGLVYAAIYRSSGDSRMAPVAVYEPANLPMVELLAELEKTDDPVVFPGDARPLFAAEIAGRLGARVTHIPPVCEMLRPASVAGLGAVMFAGGEQADPFAMLPVYIRKAEAEAKWEARQL